MNTKGGSRGGGRVGNTPLMPHSSRGRLMHPLFKDVLPPSCLPAARWLPTSCLPAAHQLPAHTTRVDWATTDYALALPARCHHSLLASTPVSFKKVQA